MIAALLEQGTLRYAVPGQPRIKRPFRAWALENGKPLIIVTERLDDEGMSIENAAEAVREAIEARWGTDCRIIQHHAWDTGVPYAEQSYRDGRMHWWPVNLDALRAELGPTLDDTVPGASTSSPKEER